MQKKRWSLFCSSYLDLKHLITFIMAAIYRLYYKVSVLRSTFVKDVESDVISCFMISYLFSFGSSGISDLAISDSAISEELLSMEAFRLLDRRLTLGRELGALLLDKSW